jgi:hypothetical protein
MKAEYVNNPVYLSTVLRDAARDVLAGAITIEDAAQKFDLPVEWIEQKCKQGEYFQPPQPTRKVDPRLNHLRKQPSPRSVLTEQEKTLKDGFKDRRYSQLVQHIQEAATEVQSNQLTIEAAAEKYDVPVSDIQKRMKDACYAPERPLPPNCRRDPRLDKKSEKRRGGSMEQIL